MDDYRCCCLHVERVSVSKDDLHLVASHDELYIAHFRPAEGFINIHMLDFERMEWENLNIKDEVLFLGDIKCCGLRSLPSSSEHFHKHLNSVFYLRHGDVFVGYSKKGHLIHRYNAQYIADGLSMPVHASREDEKPNIWISSPIWYFPHLSCSVDSVYED